MTPRPPSRGHRVLTLRDISARAVRWPELLAVVGLEGEVDAEGVATRECPRGYAPILASVDAVRGWPVVRNMASDPRVRESLLAVVGPVFAPVWLVPFLRGPWSRIPIDEEAALLAIGYEGRRALADAYHVGGVDATRAALAARCE